MSLKFEILKRDNTSKAKRGILTLKHGVVNTPAFMPVGTNGTVKGIYHKTVSDIGYKLILANTYHLYLRPGMEVMKAMGGLHKFSNWDYNILTDSGGFQVFSLSKLNKIKREGVKFQSHIDGSYHMFTPEKVVDIQQIIGSDISMLLDVCTPPEITYKKAKEAMYTTHYWADRALKQRETYGESFVGNQFGIVQGNFFEDLRKESADFFNEKSFEGLAIGGLSVGEEKSVFIDYLAYTADKVREDKPRYVMGIGTPDYILEAVENGIDLFDCVFATRTARNGSLFTDDGMISIKKSCHTFDSGPISEGCTCTACTKYSRSYMRHLFRAKEMFGAMLATEHNLTYLYNLMDRIHKAIDENKFAKFKRDYLARYYANHK